MTQLEDRLRAALLETPTPQTTIANPLTDLDRRVGRAKARWATAGVAALAVVVAAIVVPLSLAGKNAKAAKFEAPPPVAWSDHRVTAMTVDAKGSVWTLSTNRRNNPTFSLEQHDPGTGDVVATWTVPDWAQDVYAADGYLWMWGGGDGGYPHGMLEALDPATGRHFTKVFGAGQAIGSAPQQGQPVAAFSGGLVALEGAPQSIVTFSVAGSHIVTNSVVIHNDATAIFTDGDFAYPYTSRQSQDVVNVGPPSGIGPAAQAVRISGVPLTVGARGIWTRSGQQVVQAGKSGQVGSAIYPQSSWGGVKYPTMAAADSNGGLYVGWSKNFESAGASLLTYYSAKALRSENPVPTTTLQAGGVSALSLDIAGGVVYLEPGALTLDTVYRWNPTGTPSPTPQPTKVAATAAQTWQKLDGSDVTVGDGSVWSLTNVNNQHANLLQRDPTTGHVVSTYAGPLDNFMSFGLGRVWLWNYADGTHSDLQQAVYDPATSKEQILSLPREIGSEQMHFYGNAGWIQGNAGRWLRFTVGAAANAPARVVLEPASAYQAALRQAAAAECAQRGVQATAQSAQLLASSVAVVPEGYVERSGSRLFIDNDRGQQVAGPLQVPRGTVDAEGKHEAPNFAAVDAAGGLYVVPYFTSIGIVYFSPAALKSTRPLATAELHRRVVKVVADPTGGVVAQTSGGLLRWNPTVAT